MYSIEFKTYYRKSGDDDGEAGRQALSNKTTEWGLYSGKRERRNPGRISQHVRTRAGVTGPGVEGVNGDII